MINRQEYICETPERLDVFLTAKIGQTRSQIAGLIKHECVYVDEKKVSNRSGVSHIYSCLFIIHYGLYDTIIIILFWSYKLVEI